MDENRQAQSRIMTRLQRTRSLTRLAIMGERLWPRLLPLLIVAAIFLIISWAGLFRLMPDMVRFAVAGLLGLVALSALWPLRSLPRTDHPPFESTAGPAPPFSFLTRF